MTSSETREAEPTELEPSVPELPIYVSTAKPRPPLTPEEEEKLEKAQSGEYPEFLDKNSAKENNSFRNSEWGPEAAEAMCRQVRHFKVPGGKEGQVLTMGDLIDRTPKNLISKVMLEEKVFKTWFGGRTVLLGDGKSFASVRLLNAAAGVGAITAMHDAVALAKWIATLQTKDRDELNVIFKEYYKE
ncbi:hypothetical protein BGZ82_007224 [Podila clonocystis]|nr:hypothetical protein BGZ82_007224 [Podila clonocystis]